MNEILEEKLRHLNEDELMLKALKDAFEEVIDDNKPNIDEGDNDELLGQKYRAYNQAKILLNKVLLDIESNMRQKVGSDKINKGK